jgi:hypothetical protein
MPKDGPLDMSMMDGMVDETEDEDPAFEPEMGSGAASAIMRAVKSGDSDALESALNRFLDARDSSKEE